MISSPSGRALGAAGVASGSAAKRTQLKQCGPGFRLYETPVFMRVEEPFRWLQCGFWAGKVNGKIGISTKILGFYGFISILCLFLPIFPRFLPALLVANLQKRCD